MQLASLFLLGMKGFTKSIYILIRFKVCSAVLVTVSTPRVMTRLPHICNCDCNRNRNHIKGSTVIATSQQVKCECSLSNTYRGVRRIACPDSTRFAGCRAPAAYCPAGRPRSGDSCLHPLNTFSYSLKHING